MRLLKQVIQVRTRTLAKIRYPWDESKGIEIVEMWFEGEDDERWLW